MKFQLNRKQVFTTLALTAVFNTIIALFLTYLGFGKGLFINFVFSQSIGLCICSLVLAGHYFVRGPSIAGHLVILLVAMPLGAAVGAFAGSQIAGIPFYEILRGRPTLFIQMLFAGILFGTIITNFFISRERISQAQDELQEERIRNLTLEKETLKTRLKLLQAQIEPHFLFNTLSNILSLLDSDPTKGKAMLVDLTRYLRASLSRTRDSMTTLGQEMDLVRAYLEIHKVRMGKRLRHTIEVPDNLRDVPFPPMLIQPLVENAVKHGIEPSLEGGGICIKAEEGTGCYRLIVSDTGTGLIDDSTAGVGLTNIRERLDALYNGRGRLLLEDNQPSGLKATMEVPRE